MKSHILLVEDDADLGAALTAYLSLHDLEVSLVLDGQQALNFLEVASPELCILDVMMPQMDGFTLAQNIRRQFGDLPFLFLTARALRTDHLRGFALGADDYLTKPVDEEMLVARIRAILRRAQPRIKAGAPPEQRVFGKFHFDCERGVLAGPEGEKQLTEKESDLLALLSSQPGRLLTREWALNQIWGGTDYFKRKSMDVYLTRLRKALAADPRVAIVNLKGRGFILQVSEDEYPCRD